MLIGELIGDVSTDAFTFEAYKDIRKFDFVAVKNPKEGKEWILAQVDAVKKSPEGKTECDANIIGYREKGMLKQPRHVIKPDSMVYRADEDVIAETLGLTQDGLYMGRLETNPDIRIFINPSDLYKHIAVLAKTGAGKSYATGVMIEELIEQGYPVIIVDPHGEYHSLQHPNDDLETEDGKKFGVEAKGYKVTEYSTNTTVNPEATELRFSSKNLDAKELGQLIPTNLTNSQLEVLYNALKELKKWDEYTLQDIIDKAMNQESKAKWNLVNILEIVQDSNLFSEEPTELGSLVQRGKVSIINLKGVDPENQEMVVYKLAKELFEQRKIGELEPFIMVMEEAHNFVPERNFGKAVCSDILRTIASEGRKFGLGIGVISQRPARVDKNILSQCNTQLIMRVTNPNDLNAIGRSFEGVTSEVQKSITSLPPGVGLVLGKEYPVMTDIRTRRSKHGGVTQQLTAPADEADEDAADVGLKPGIEEDAPTAQEAVEAEAPAAADEAAEAVSSAEAHMPSKRVPEEKANDNEDAEEVSGMTAIVPELDAGKLRKKLGENVKTAYYPLWIVSMENDRIVVDGTDGEIKDTALLERETESVAGDDHTEISTDISEGDAIRIAKEKLDGIPSGVKKIYYPYFTAGTRVFDAVKDEEI